MISVVASIIVKPGAKEEFIRIFKANVPNVLAEKGCIEYLPTVDFDSGIPVQERDDNVVTIIEKWETMEDLDAHGKAPHMAAYREKSKDLVASISIKVLTEA